MVDYSPGDPLAKMIAARAAERTAGFTVEKGQQVTETTVRFWCLATELADPRQRRAGT